MTSTRFICFDPQCGRHNSMARSKSVMECPACLPRSFTLPLLKEITKQTCLSSLPQFSAHLSAAMWAAVRPSAVAAFTLAPAERRTRATAAWPRCTAACSGVVCRRRLLQFERGECLVEKLLVWLLSYFLSSPSILLLNCLNSTCVVRHLHKLTINYQLFLQTFPPQLNILSSFLPTLKSLQAHIFYL